MIEKTIYDYLKDKLNPVPVFLEIPNNTPKRFVLIQKTGSRGNRHLVSSTIAIQSYDETLYKTSQLNEAVKMAMFDLASVDEVTKSELNSDYNYTDITTKKYRYQAVFDVTHY